MIRQSPNKTFIDVLMKSDLLPEEDLIKAISEVQLKQERLSTYLIKHRLLSSHQIIDALSKYLKIDTVNLKRLNIDQKVIERIPVKFASYYKFVPVDIKDGQVTLAVSMPLEMGTLDEIRIHLGLEPKIVLALEEEIEEALKKYYGLASDTIDKILTRDGRKIRRHDDESIEDIEKQSDDPSVTKLVNQIILEAYQKRATDIHIEPYRNKVRFRYRIDGSLVDANLPAEAKHFLQPILSRIKIMANLSITEKRLPQDGSAVVKTRDQNVDLRVSTIPTPRGESMVIRILPSGTSLLKLEKLGFNRDNAEKFRALIKRPHGVIFVTGPTGSGKTTTLYACLNEINDPNRKIITIEDPVEYEMEGITQIQIHPGVGLDFAKGLRSILRHDPDILMVGEVRDLETAEIAIRTALTGHLVFSTLHTNDAASGMTRLIDMGIEPYLLASSIEAFVAQRLVRVICPHCKVEDTHVPDHILSEIAEASKETDIKSIKVYKGAGCDHCNHTGYFGRTAIYEILTLDEHIRDAIFNKPRAEQLKRLALSSGMISLRQDGWRNVLQGVTTPEEVMNVTIKDDLVELRGKVKSGIPESKQELPISTIQEKLEPTPLMTSPKITSTEKSNVMSAPKEPSVKKEVVKETKSNENNAAKSQHDRVSTDVIKQVSKEFQDRSKRPRPYEFRAYPRLAEQVPVNIVFTKPQNDKPNMLVTDGDKLETVTRDISGAGLCFMCTKDVTVGTIIEVTVNLNNDNNIIECLAKTCRVDRENDQYAISAYFLDISNNDRVRIHQYAKNKLAAASA